MVGKLIKYDFMSFFRLLLPVQLVIIGIAVINRIIQIFERYDTVSYEIVFTSSIVLLVIASIVAIVMCFIIAIVRFYQGMYSNEGYLSNTLPVTPAQHLWSKLLTSMIFAVGTFFAIFIAVNIATLGDVGAELYKAGGYLFARGFSFLHGHLILYMLEGIVFLLLSEAVSFLMVYFCISVGQLANRKKILLAFGVYFGLYVLAQIASTIIIILGVILSGTPFIEALGKAIGDFATSHPIATVHIAMLIAIIVNAVFGLVYFLISRAIINRRLNLT